MVKMRAVKVAVRACILAWVLVVLALSVAWGSEGGGGVLVAPLTGTVGVQMEEFVQQAVRRAAQEGRDVLVFQLDTPGGLVESMRGIVQSILASPVPVVVWVPGGGRAASAGAFIVQAAHVAAMAPGTNIGAAHPVSAGGEDLGENDMSRKVLNDLRAQIRSVAQLRGRNQTDAQLMVDESLSLTAQEALERRVVDLIAADVPSLLAALDGRRVKLDSARTVTIRLRPGAPTERMEMTLQERLIQFVSSPEVAYMLLSGGLLAIFFDVMTPGGFVLGTTGALMLLLGSIGLKMLPFSWAGVLLLGAGIAVMVGDLLVGGMGILSVLGLAVFCLGGIFLFQAPGGELLRFSLSAVAGAAVTLGGCFVLFAVLVFRGMRRRVTTGERGMIGLEAVAVTKITPEGGRVRCHGELWRARTEGGTMPAGSSGVVAAMEGITLVVRPGTPAGEED